MIQVAGTAAIFGGKFPVVKGLMAAAAWLGLIVQQERQAIRVAVIVVLPERQTVGLPVGGLQIQQQELPMMRRLAGPANGAKIPMSS